MNLYENIKSALLAIRGNMLRAFLTLMIIAFGIMALVGILTAIDSIIYSMSDSLSGLGANSFSIERAAADFQSRQGGRIKKAADVISYRQALDFKERYDFPAHVSISFQGTGSALARFKNIETNPNIAILGVDENYLITSGNSMNQGRFFNAAEALSTSRLAVIGIELAKQLYTDPAKAIDNAILVNSQKYTVIGVLDAQGSSMNQNSDRMVMIPLYLGKQLYASANTNYRLQVQLSGPELMNSAISEATGLMRSVRNLKIREADDFEITMSNAILKIIKENTVTLRLGAIIIGIMTMLGAAIGLMNIMLVSVTERTREIGIVKAIGATASDIRIQFLTEAILISLIGGFLGIVLGILAGNGVSLITGGAFIVPWLWIATAFLLCILTGIFSGMYPAIRASQLDPIESLRYE